MYNKKSEQEKNRILIKATEEITKNPSPIITAGVGHNSGNKQGIDVPVTEVSGARLKSFIERVERLNEEGAAIREDVKDVYGEAKASGFDTKIMRKLVAIRKSNLEKRREEQQLLELYASAIQLDLGI